MSRLRSWPRVILAIAFAWICVNCVSEASTFRIANLQDLIEQSERIFVGHVLAVEQNNDNAARWPQTEYTFAVTEGIRGVDGDTTVVRQFGFIDPVVDAAGQLHHYRITGMPRYSVGQELLLFVIPEGELGLASPVGFEQGVFQIRSESSGARVLVNGLNNANLTHELDVQFLEKSGARSGASRARDLRRGPIAYENLIGILKEVAR